MLLWHLNLLVGVDDLCVFGERARTKAEKNEKIFAEWKGKRTERVRIERERSRERKL